jgi:hypothetical protein
MEAVLSYLLFEVDYQFFNIEHNVHYKHGSNFANHKEMHIYRIFNKEWIKVIQIYYHSLASSDVSCRLRTITSW